MGTTGDGVPSRRRARNDDVAVLTDRSYGRPDGAGPGASSASTGLRRLGALRPLGHPASVVHERHTSRDDLVDRPEQVARQERLGDEAVRAGLQGLLAARVGGQDDDP
jgi:hypothetical protein